MTLLYPQLNIAVHSRTIFLLQHKCTNQPDWTIVNATTHQVPNICNYKPYTKVECSVRAINNGTELGVNKTVTTYTSCAGR